MGSTSDNLPKVSIIIACYNDPDVSTAVKSAHKQSYANKEIILVDDGSNELTKKTISSVEDLVDRLIVQENQGQSIARNRGIEESSGTLILNLDSDDFFEEGFCEKAVQKIIKDENIKIVTCKARRFNKQGEIDVFTPGGGGIDQFLFRNSALGSSLFRRCDWERSGGYEEELPILGFEDWELYIKILKDGGYAAVIDEILFHYQVRENSTTARIRYEKAEKFKYIVQQHKDLYKENFNDLIDYLFERIKKAENEKIKAYNKIDFKLGRQLLKPLRFIKSLRRR